MLDGLIAIKIDIVARKTTLAYLNHAKLNAEQARRRIADLNKLPAFGRVADKIDLGERLIALDMVMLIDRGDYDAVSGKPTGTPLTGKVDWGPALRNINRWLDRMVVACREKDRTTREKRFSELHAEIEAGIARFKPEGKHTTPQDRGQLRGYTLMGELHRPLCRGRWVEERADQEQRNLPIAFALAAHHHDTGRYPDSLDKLVPKYLESISDDLYTGKPLRYRQTEKGYLFYSVGVNGLDDNGLGYGEGPTTDDLSVRMPLP
jgi:hypothetical protein